MILTIELDQDGFTAIQQIKARTRMDLSKILRYALSLMLWTLKQREQRRIVASMDESQRTYRELDVDATYAQPSVATDSSATPAADAA